MGSDKNTPNEENAPEDTSPKEHNALDRKSPIENHSEQEKEVAQSTSGAWFARLKRLSGFRGPILKSQWLRNVGVSLFVTALFAGAQLCLANNQANTAERLENLRYVRERSQVTTPIDLSPQCLRTGEFILTPESTTTNSSADDKDHFTPELPFKDFDLKGQNLSGLWLNCANFSEANLEGADFVTALFAGAQLCLANNQANTAERLENLRYVRERSQVTTPIDLSPQCLRTGEFILTPESTTTNSSADDKDHFTPELPFKDFDLKGQNLSGLWLNCANFSEANLEGADLSNTYLIGANLSGANLRNANLKHSQLQLARLENADLSGADLSGANLSGTPTDLSILETATLCETTLPEDNLGLTQQQKERLQELGATFTKEEDEEP